MIGFVSHQIPLSLRRTLPKRVTQHLWFIGEFNLVVSNSVKVRLRHEGHQLENEMFWYGLNGCHEAKSHQLVNDFLTTFKPKNFFDIGASTGTYGLIAKGILPDCRIYFFEPQKEALDILEINLKLNGVSAQIFELALSDYCGLAHIFPPSDGRFVYQLTVNRNLYPEEMEVVQREIRVSRFDCLNFEISNCTNFFKLDAEYHEREVLSGFVRTVTENVKLNSGWLIEVVTDELGRYLEEYFPRDKFNYYDVDDKNFMVRQTDAIRKSSFFNYFIVSKERSKYLSSLGTP